MQDENIAGWHKGMFGKQVQHSCLGIVKSKLMALPNVVILDRFIPTTKLCPKCHSVKNDMTLADRVYECSCGYQEDNSQTYDRYMGASTDNDYCQLLYDCV